MNPIKGVMFAYGTLLIVLGYIGYTEGSVVSLIAGGIAGVLALVFAAISYNKPRIGYIGVTVVALLILGNSTAMYVKSGEFYPHMVLILASLVTMGILIAAHFQAVGETKARAAKAGQAEESNDDFEVIKK